MRRLLVTSLAVLIGVAALVAVPAAQAGVSAVTLRSFGHELVDDAISPGRVFLTDPDAGQVLVTDLAGAPAHDPVAVPAAQGLATTPSGGDVFVTGLLRS